MSSTRIGLASTAALAVALGLTGCGASSEESAGADQQKPVLSGSATKMYPSLKALRADSSAVVRVTASSGATQEPLDQAGTSTIPATITTVSVDKVISGSVNGADTLSLRQTGSEAFSMPDFSPILVPGKKYVLYIKPFEFVPGKPTGQYTITGDAGEFGAAAGGKFEALSPAAKLGGLPSGITEAAASASD